MTNRVDRGMGYLGLFLIGAISWLADHIRPARVPTALLGARRHVPPPAARLRKLETTSPAGTHGGRRAA